jgi:hypothetical protein
MARKIGIALLSLLLTACFRISPEKDTALPVLPEASLLDASEEIQIRAINREAFTLLQAKDYAGLEAETRKYDAEESPFGGGANPGAIFARALTELPNRASDADYQKRLADLTAWLQAQPGSVPATVALAGTLANYAWFARGGGYADSVTDNGWALFKQRLLQAQQTLDQVDEAQRSSDLSWYLVMSQVGLGLSMDHDDYLKLIREAIALKPTAPEIYSHASIYLLPRWYGADGELATFATQSCDDIGGDNGDILYARIAKSIWSYSYDINVFTDTGFSWPRVEHGMELICNQYPHSTIMMNYFCLFAAQAQQREVARALFDHLGNRFVGHREGGPWWSDDDFEKAKAWAQGP